MKLEQRLYGCGCKKGTTNTTTTTTNTTTTTANGAVVSTPTVQPTASS